MSTVFCMILALFLDHTTLKQCQGEFEMQQDHEKELKDIIGGLACPADFKCYTQALKNFRKVEHVGLEPFLEVLEVHAYECPFQIPAVGVNHVACPVRAYISKKLKK